MEHDAIFQLCMGGIGINLKCFKCFKDVSTAIRLEQYQCHFFSSGQKVMYFSCAFCMINELCTTVYSKMLWLNS